MAYLLRKRKEKENLLALQALKQTCVISHSGQVIIKRDKQFKGYYGTIVSKNNNVYRVQLSAVTSYRVCPINIDNLFFIDAKLKTGIDVSVVSKNNNDYYTCKNIESQEKIYHIDEFAHFYCEIVQLKNENKTDEIIYLNSEIENDDNDENETDEIDTIPHLNINEEEQETQTHNFRDNERITLDYDVLTREEQQYKSFIFQIGKTLDINTHFIDFEKLNIIIEKISDLNTNKSLNKIDLNYITTCIFLHECIKENIILPNLEVIFNKLYINKIFKKTDISQTNFLNIPYNKYNDLTELHLLQKNMNHTQARIQNKSIKQLLCLVFENANYFFTDVFNINLNQVIKTRSKFTFRSCIELKPIKTPQEITIRITLTAIIQELQLTSDLINGDTIYAHIKDNYPNLKYVTYQCQNIDVDSIDNNVVSKILKMLDDKKKLLDNYNTLKCNSLSRRLQSMQLVEPKEIIL